MNLAFALIPVFVIVLIIPILIGVYVYQDASRRGMNAVLWTLIAVFAPSLIGFIIYLLLRRNDSDLLCPGCGSAVKAQFAVCPNCGTKLRLSCPSCKVPVEVDWRVCPHCASPLPERQDDVQCPEPRRDAALGKILLAIIIIPLLAAGLLLAMSSLYAHGSSCSIRELTLAEYALEQENKTICANVQAWLDGIDPQAERAYALRYDHDRDEHFFLVYVPHAGGDGSLAVRNGLFSDTLVLDLQSVSGSGHLICLQNTSARDPRLSVRLDGRRLPCETSIVAYNPTLFYLVPQYDNLSEGAEVVFLPERVSVVKIVDNHTVDVLALSDEDMLLQLLGAIDAAPYLDTDHDIYGRPDGSGGYDFKDGFEIIIEYRVREDLVLHEDMIRCLVFVQDGACYLIDSYRPDEGRIIRQLDADVYRSLSELFIRG